VVKAAAGSQDVFNNLHWKHNIKTEATMAAAKANLLPDLSAFYGRFSGSTAVNGGKADGDGSQGPER
jgi:hypothetical protein